MKGRPNAGAGLLAERAVPHAHFGYDAQHASQQAEESRAALEASLAENELLRTRLAASRTALATLAHEIRNPLASLELFTTLLADEPARAAEWLVQLQAGLRSLGSTVANVLSFHGAGGEPQLEPVVLSRTVTAAVEFARPLIAQRGLGLHVQGSTLSGTVRANPAALQQLILNLIANAVRHTEAPGMITVAVAKAAPSHLLLTIRDTGSGIAPEHLERLFTAGWSARGDSTGLGLAVCRRIAAQHGTVLKVQTTLGEGAAFSMEFKTL